MSGKEEKRAEILKAAARVFVEYGFDGAKIEDIAKAAGIGKGTVYEYFESKTDLFREMLRNSVEEYRQALAEKIAQGRDIREKILNCSQYSTRFLSENLDMLEMAWQASTLMSKETRTWLIEEKLSIFRLLEDMVKDGVARAELRQGLEPELAVFSILGTIHQYYGKKVFLDEAAPEKLDHEAVVDVILNGLK
ncbi:TetR/AcrR family transcriptional regulator [Paradesulfitobacterium ferrireducens]|uniref:TetR/AcrR family transcriptional regulator n=1 Tax=Paradesulfitobacterium ferrireducens TaxID=2816476 RepID=UPI001A8F6AA0|nr:TetR/AcrR family transcriptional regulator [Paradesulfitobacterium ferrireducens]